MNTILQNVSTTELVKLAERIIAQDEVASQETSVVEVMKDIMTKPTEVIKYLLELLEQNQ